MNSNGLFINDSAFDPNPNYTQPLPVTEKDWVPPAHWVDLFDQNGYALTVMEQAYADANGWPPVQHRPWEQALKYNWISQVPTEQYAVLNHSMLFERKGLADQAKRQLTDWADCHPVFHKVRNIKPKWGLDFSMDWVDREGNAFEILHWEWDDFEFDRVHDRKLCYERIFLGMDWPHAGGQLLKHRAEWVNLDFFAQSDWKCNYFGIEKEQFKQVVWK